MKSQELMEVKISIQKKEDTSFEHALTINFYPTCAKDSLDALIVYIASWIDRLNEEGI